MRWEALFSDLEAQWDAAEAADLAAEVADRTRSEVARLRLVDRLRPCLGADLRFGTIGAPGGAPLAGRLLALGADWLLVQEAGAREALVPSGALLWVDGLAASSARPGHEGPLAAKLDLRYALRGLCRDRALLAVTLVDGAVLRGLAHRVGADFLELAEHRGVREPEWAPAAGRGRSAWNVRTISLGAVAVVRAG